jgi:predicted RND superfamily exporter protein
VTILTALPLKQAQLDNSLEAVVPENDPEKLFLNEVLNTFGSDESTIIAISAPEGLTRYAIERTTGLVDEMANISGVRRVLSPFTIPLIVSNQGLLDIRTAAERSEMDVSKISDLLAEDLLTSGYLFRASQNRAQVWAVIAELEDTGPQDNQKMNQRTGGRISQELREMVVQEAERLAGSLPFQWVVSISGIPYIKVKLVQHLHNDLKSYGFLSIVILSFFLFITLRSVSGVILPCVTVFLTVIWTMGLLVATGNKINPYTAMIPTLILFIGVTNAVRFLTHYQQELACFGHHKEALTSTLKNIVTPCLLNTVTTSAGFAALSLSNLELIKTMGGFMVVGMFFCLIITFTLIPALLTLIDQDPLVVKKVHQEDMLEGFLLQMGRLVIRQKNALLGATILLVLIATIGFNQLEVETHFLRYFRESDPIVKSVRFIESSLTGTTTMDIVLQLALHEDLTQPRVMDKLVQIENELISFPEISKILSPRHILLRLHRALTADPEADLSLNPHTLAQELFLLRASAGNNPLQGLFDSASRRIRVRTLMPFVSSPRMREITDHLERALEEKLPSQTHITGTVPLLLKTMDRVVWGQVKSFALIFFVVLTVMIIIMRSLRIGLVSMIPNVMPIFMAYAIMGFVAIPLSNITAVESCIGLGIAIDDTIHYLYRFRKEFIRTRSYAEAIQQTTLTTGRAIMFTSVILSAGFCVFLFSNFQNTADFGVIAMAIMIAALIGDLVILPICLLLFRPFGIERPQTSSQEVVQCQK